MSWCIIIESLVSDCDKMKVVHSTSGLCSIKPDFNVVTRNETRNLFDDLDFRMRRDFIGNDIDCRLWHPLSGIKSCYTGGHVHYFDLPRSLELLPMQFHIRVSKWTDKDFAKIGDILSTLKGHLVDKRAKYDTHCRSGLVVCIVNKTDKKDYIGVWRWRPNGIGWDIPCTSSICVSSFVEELGDEAARPTYTNARVDYACMP